MLKGIHCHSSGNAPEACLNAAGHSAKKYSNKKASSTKSGKKDTAEEVDHIEAAGTFANKQAA